jgi:dihydroorotase
MKKYFHLICLLAFSPLFLMAQSKAGSLLIKNGTVLTITKGNLSNTDVLIVDGKIKQIGANITAPAGVKTVDATGKFVMPGIIDDQVHFREPGLTHKADLYTEPRAAVAGGVTSFMEMPNVKPPTLTQELLEEKYQIAAAKSLANYSFFMGASNDNLDEVLKTNSRDVCGIKIFMGSQLSHDSGFCGNSSPIRHIKNIHT